VNDIMYICIILAMEQSPSWANGFLASQEIPRILWSTIVLYLIYKYPPPVYILRQINPVHGPHLTSWRFILILSSYLRVVLPSGSCSSGFPPKPSIHFSYPSYMLHAPPTSFFWNWSPEQYTYLLRNADH